jgi:hypothetical protein
MDRNYYVCSIGQPDEGYDDENLRRCITNNCFVLHEDNLRKGAIREIKENDILILKYKKQFIGYGRAVSSLEITNEENGWNHIVSVNLWITGRHSGIYGIQDAQEGGTNYDTVKKVERLFALQNIEEIGFPF